MLYVTFTNFGCVCPRTMDFFVSNVFGSGNPFQIVTNAWPLRMTMKRKVTWCCTWPLLTLAVFVLKRWNFVFVSNVFGSRNPFPLVTNAWPSRMTLKSKVRWCCTWPLLTLAVFVLERWCFLFLMFFGSGNPFQLVTKNSSFYDKHNQS